MRELETNREAIVEEERRLRRLRVLVDIAAAAVRGYPMSRSEAEAVVETLREQVVRMFPDKGETFELIYGARFRRLIDERFGGE
jgi:hypothetical protein